MSKNKSTETISDLTKKNNDKYVGKSKYLLSLFPNDRAPVHSQLGKIIKKNRF